MLHRIEVVDVCIQYVESVGVPQSTHELTAAFLYCIIVETVRKPRCGIRVEVPADCICSVLAQCIHWVNGIALGLTHLLTVFILNMAKNDNVLIRCFVK